MSINNFKNELITKTAIYNASFDIGEKPVEVQVEVRFDGEYQIDWEFIGEATQYTDEEIDEIDNFINNNY